MVRHIQLFLVSSLRLGLEYLLLDLLELESTTCAEHTYLFLTSKFHRESAVTQAEQTLIIEADPRFRGEMASRCHRYALLPALFRPLNCLNSPHCNLLIKLSICRSNIMFPKLPITVESVVTLEGLMTSPLLTAATPIDAVL